MFASAQQGGQFTAMVLVRNHRECLKHCFEALARTAGLVADLDELLEVMGDLAVVPGKQDRLDIREIFVRRFCWCTSSPSGFWRGLRPERR